MGKYSSYRANQNSMRVERDRRICGPGHKYLDSIGKCASYAGFANKKKNKPRMAKQSPQPQDISGNKPIQPSPEAKAMQAIQKEAVARKSTK